MGGGGGRASSKEPSPHKRERPPTWRKKTYKWRKWPPIEGGGGELLLLPPSVGSHALLNLCDVDVLKPPPPSKIKINNINDKILIIY